MFSFFSLSSRASVGPPTTWNSIDLKILQNIIVSPQMEALLTHGKKDNKKLAE
jgi:hypothetical protein